MPTAESARLFCNSPRRAEPWTGFAAENGVRSCFSENGVRSCFLTLTFLNNQKTRPDPILSAFHFLIEGGRQKARPDPILSMTPFFPLQSLRFIRATLACVGCASVFLLAHHWGRCRFRSAWADGEVVCPPYRATHL